MKLTLGKLKLTLTAWLQQEKHTFLTARKIHHMNTLLPRKVADCPFLFSQIKMCQNTKLFKSIQIM